MTGEVIDPRPPGLRSGSSRRLLSEHNAELVEYHINGVRQGALFEIQSSNVIGYIPRYVLPVQSIVLNSYNRYFIMPYPQTFHFTVCFKSTNNARARDEH